MNKRFENCIFDLYGTLVDIRTDEGMPSLWKKMASLYASYGAVYTPAQLQAAYGRIVAEMESTGRRLRRDSHEAHPEIQIEYVFARLFSEKGIPCDCGTPEGRELAVSTGQAFRKYSLLYIRLYPYAKELLQTLRAAGCRVWLLSNAQAIFTRYELDCLGLAESFDGIYLSSDYGCKKPEEKFFRLLLKEQKIPVRDAVMIGNDGICDIAGARSVGLSTIYIHSNISPNEELPEADLALDHMDLEQVGRWLIQC